MWQNLQETVDLVTFNEEILNENFIFCAVLGICINNTNVIKYKGGTEFKTDHTKNTKTGR